MVFEFDILEAESLVSVRVRGTGDFQKGIESILTVANDARFKNGFNVLVDLCHLNYHPSLEELRAFADVLISLKDKCTGKTALVVSNFFHYGFGKVLGGFLELAGIKMQVFRNPLEAIKWFKD
ncbi:MAG: hypothetical protein ACK412_09385 [Chloroherpetonaceae bacterium]